jgi:hypothetical protein
MSYNKPKITKPATNKSKAYLSEPSKSLSNSTRFLNFIEKDIIKDGKDVVDFKITIVPKKSNLYQGTDFQFNLQEVKTPSQDNINRYFDYYNKRHFGTYYVSSKKIPSKYRSHYDFSNIIYTTLPEFLYQVHDIDGRTDRHKYIYPLYYIPENKGINIKYKLKKDLFLINISDEKNIEFLSKLIEIILNSNKDIEVVVKELIYKIMIIYSSLIKKQPQSYVEKILSYFYLKISEIKFDMSLIKSKNQILISENDEILMLLFKNLFIPKIKNIYNIDIDGWIYLNSSDLDEEILLNSNESLIFDSVTKMKKFEYYDIPTITEFMKSLENKKVTNNFNIKPYTILNNYQYIIPKKL